MSSVFRAGRSPHRPRRSIRALLVVLALSLAIGMTSATAFGAPAAAAPGTAGPAGPAGAAGESSPWHRPLRGQPGVVRDFSPPAVPWGRGHRGVDLAARPGQPVFAAGAGRVLYAGMLAGRGVVSIVHGALRTTYEPVVPSVQPGQPVSAGDRIGVVGDAPTHCVPHTCLHWGLLRGEDYLDPLGLLGRGPLRLLPVWGVPPVTP